MATALRPQALFGWFTPLSKLKGVGPATLQAFTRLIAPSRGAGDILTVRDLLFLPPYDIIDRTQVRSIEEAEVGAYVTLEVSIDEHYPPPMGRRVPYRISASDDSGSLLLTFFHVKGDYLSRQLPAGQKRLICGVVEIYDGMKQISHPDVMAPLSWRAEVLTLNPVYPLVAGLSHKTVSNVMREALLKVGALPEWANGALVKERGWARMHEALRRLHQPEAADDIAVESLPRTRLAYDEAFANQLALALLRRQEQSLPSTRVPLDEAVQARFFEALPFTLTQGQREVVAAISADMASGLRMVRMLQGDVGSGKTVVALAAMAQVAAIGGQSALMAPTDILARQHAQTLAPLAEAMGLTLVLITGKLSPAERKMGMAMAASGEASIVVGTHALFQDAVRFQNLMLVVVDEQHRFGVEQRLRLTEKGVAPHLLQMSATPIPRSLTMTVYGDMESSVLTEKPAGRQPIDTRALPLERADEVVEAVARAMAKGQKLYWICPLIEQSEETSDKVDMAAVEERFRVLKHRFGDVVGMMHGRMKTAEREAVMQEFAFGKLQLLVATTVVEVGVNVPEATIIIIEHAERFGLAQLHQLRGRVGRGSEASRCLLLYDADGSDVAMQRLKTIRGSNDGFMIAEEDLRLRGAGDVLGTRQTGLPQFHFVNFATHMGLIRVARDDAWHLLEQDPQLTSERGQACRLLLGLFGYDEETASLRAA